MNFSYQPLDQDDQKLFQTYSKGIDKAVREVFPSIPANFKLEPVTIQKIPACGMMYSLMVALPDGQFAKVAFSVGGMQMKPPPGEKEPEQQFRVDPTPSPSAYE